MSRLFVSFVSRRYIKVSSVYKLKRGFNTVYVGRTDREVEVRINEHRRSGKRFSYYVPYRGLTRAESIALEKELIRKLRTEYNR